MTLTMTHPIEKTTLGFQYLAEKSFLPYGHLEPEFSHERVARAFAAQMASLQASEGVHVTSYSDGEATATGYWQKAAWETKHLGYWCARLDQLLCPASGSPSLKGSLLARLKDDWRALSYRYIFTRIDTADHHTINALEEIGFVTVDNISLLVRDAGKNGGIPALATGVDISPATEEDLFHLARIAREAFREDRYHNDPLIPNETADAMHSDWIHNQVVSGLAEEVLVARVSGLPVGFVSMVIDRDAETHLGAPVGTIVLLAVCDSVRGRGFGKALTGAALEWFSRQDVELVQVGTQAWNVPAIRTYLAAGFKPARSYTTLRLYLA